MKCKHCGEEITNDSAFCEYCGHKIGNRGCTIKLIDIQWCLLSIMIMISLLISQFGTSLSFKKGYAETSLLFIPVVVLFALFVFYGIKKYLRLPFIILSCIFLITNTTKLIYALNPGDACRVEARITWEDDWKYKYGGVIHLVSSEDYNIQDFYAVKNQIRDMQIVVTNELVKSHRNVKKEDLYETHEYYTKCPFYIELIELIALLLYISYAIIAYKKKLNINSLTL